jgi:Uma2 family endonuclease
MSMSTAKPRHLLRLEYEKAAQAYLRSLPPEHFMEATPQATQREITVESLALVKAQRPDVQYFNELLVQYPHGRRPQVRQVVPDNMVVVHDEPIHAVGSFDVPLQPVGPFWVLEYVSQHSERKDYEDSFRKYERELKVPYLLMFHPEGQELTLYRHGGRKYRTVVPNAAGRCAVPELDLEVAILDGWVRFWYKGQLVPLPADLLRQLETVRRQLRQAQQEARQAQQEAQQAREDTRQAQEVARQAREREEEARRHAERLLAQLRALGIGPQE